MSALQYFDLFDDMILFQLQKLPNNQNISQTILLKEMLTYNGKVYTGLLHFIAWLISNNGEYLISLSLGSN
jgi:hypothetical protein